MQFLGKAAIAIVFSASVVFAIDVTVFPAQVVGPNGITDGKVVIAGDQMIFVDDAQPKMSFAIPRANVRRLLSDQGTITIDLSQPLTDRYGTRTQLLLRSPEPDRLNDVVTWSGLPVASATVAPRTDEITDVQSARQALENNRVLMYPAQHGSANGRLLVKSNGVAFESVSDATKSHSWNYTDIRSFDRKAATNEIVIKLLKGDEFSVKLTNPALTDPVYQIVTDRIVMTRERLK